MVREGTRSQTGHSKPRVMYQPDTAPVIARQRKSGKTAKVAPGKTAGVVKKKTAARKPAATGAAKVKRDADKVVKKAAGAVRAATKSADKDTVRAKTVMR